MAFRKTTERSPSTAAIPKSPLGATFGPVGTTLTSDGAATDAHQGDFNNQPISSLRVLLARITWCFAGPLLLVIWTLRIASSRDGWAAPSDVGFLLVLGIVIATRWYCFSANDRADMQGHVTTRDQLHRFTRMWAVGGTIVWIVANLIGNVAAG